MNTVERENEVKLHKIEIRGKTYDTPCYITYKDDKLIDKLDNIIDTKRLTDTQIQNLCQYAVNEVQMWNLRDNPCYTYVPPTHIRRFEKLKTKESEKVIYTHSDGSKHLIVALDLLHKQGLGLNYLTQYLNEGCSNAISLLAVACSLRLGGNIAGAKLKGKTDIESYIYCMSLYFKRNIQKHPLYAQRFDPLFPFMLDTAEIIFKAKDRTLNEALNNANRLNVNGMTDVRKIKGKYQTVLDTMELHPLDFKLLS
jgi:hypothetical protein